MRADKLSGSSCFQSISQFARHTKTRVFAACDKSTIWYACCSVCSPAAKLGEAISLLFHLGLVFVDGGHHRWTDVIRKSATESRDFAEDLRMNVCNFE